jgi:16S rRNA C967 or C1407 C5-methylase (RsmB/RsmF family)/NOL1/NOP2/fmu family ribosome biogenesis protein
MPALPNAFLHSLSGLAAFDTDAFTKAHQQPAPVSVRLNTHKKITSAHFQDAQPVPWADNAFYISKQEIFALDPLWHAGAYYVQEASSMMLQQVYNQLLAPLEYPLHILDLCAAPGGKSTQLVSMMKPADVLVSNEVIQGRVGVLVENLTRWGPANTIVTQNDPAQWGNGGFLFDAIVVDAPCSGSGLFRREPEAISEWSEDNVALCAQRQQRILADIWPALKPGGFLVYSTCSYSPSEDEAIIDFAVKDLDAQSVQIVIKPQWGIVEVNAPQTKAYGCRFYPHLLQGEGFFLSVLQKRECADTLIRSQPSAKRKMLIPKAEAWQPFVNQDISLGWYEHSGTWYAMTQPTLELFHLLKPQFRIKKAGVCAGTLAQSQPVPEHDFALSHIISPGITAAELNLQQARQYLRKEYFETEPDKKGWVLARYQQNNLGWYKQLGNRINNYYPTSWRLRS